MPEKSIKSVNLLPEFFRTDKNSKFIASTIDQLIQPPQLERIDGYIGSTLTPTYISTSDVYIAESLNLRRNYQLEPAMVVRDSQGVVKDVIGLDDLTNEISIKGGRVDNFDNLYRSEFLSYDPHIDWDKFVNYQEYYWLVNGPDTITITGSQLNSTSTFTVSDNQEGTSFIFRPDGLTEDPLINLYRGNTYTFEINSEYNFYIKTSPSLGANDQYNVNVTNNGTNKGKITIIIDESTPSTLYYTSDDQQNTQGIFNIKTITEDSRINVDQEIVGKKNYTSGTGVKLSNGMKVRFSGTVIPSTYTDKEFYIEGVGSAIRLIDADLLVSSETMSDQYNENFDGSNFDEYPFDNFKKLPLNPEYITINRASKDLNPWTRYNRWVHKSVIETSALVNGLVQAVYPTDKRARRPIIEFKPDLKLYNFGSVGLLDVDVIDTTITDAFSLVEGSAGHTADEVFLQQGYRVVFAADTDLEVRSKIYEVNYVNLDNHLQLTLMEVATAVSENVISVLKGKKYIGTSWWFDGTNWKFGQQHTSLNQAPLFDLFDDQGRSYSGPYYNSSFAGNKIFSYEIGTGQADEILGFPLNYRNSVGVGSFTFKNYFNTDTFTVPQTGNDNIEISTAITYCRFSKDTGDVYKNVWTQVDNYQIPILEFHAITGSTSTVELTSIDNPSTVDFTVDVYIENDKISSSNFTKTITTGNKCLINFNNTLDEYTNVLFKIYTNVAPNNNGYYEPPIGLTNNPLNGPIASMTLSEISDHLHSMTDANPNFVGKFPGISNIRDIDGLAEYGTRLVANSNPLAFAQMFIGKQEHNLISAISKSGEQYNQFKLAFLRKAQTINDQLSPADAVDAILLELNADKDLLSSWYLSDMIAYGTDKNERTWNITNLFTRVFPIASDFDLSTLGLRSVLVYLNDEQLVYGYDYTFNTNDSSVEILTSLVPGDKLVIKDYPSTEGCYIPPTPTKLGLYPKFKPSIFVDNTYLESVEVIQGHDGSISKTYGDYRDSVILEFEKRVYNNVKAEFKQELIDINSVLPGAFRSNKYPLSDINRILSKDFIKWAGFYGIDPYNNTAFDEHQSLTWNYTKAYSDLLSENLQGSWRSVFKYFYDTDRPHTHPWEMLGFSEQPEWWNNQYGPAPYTSGNEILWKDIENGQIRQGSRKGIDPLYVRTGLSSVLPVDSQGNSIDPTTLVSNLTPFNIRQNWVFGDHSPAEVSWRRSSYWPFVVQKLLALTLPASYAAYMYDPIRVNKNLAGQWTYNTDKKFLNLKDVLIHGDNNTLTSGYSVYVSEIGTQRTRNYVSELKSDLSYVSFNLFYKVGGFVSKDKLQIVIDAIDPTSASPGALLPQEDYDLILNVSNPIKSTSISGLILQKKNGKFVIRGYDVLNPYFTVYSPIRNNNSTALTVGGISESFVDWAASSSESSTGKTSLDLTTANSSAAGVFYQVGQLVRYGNQYYRVKINHKSGNTFNPDYFQSMPYLPIKGGTTVESILKFDKKEKQIPYGSEFEKIQDVYDIILGYGDWLVDQGFVFDEFNLDLNTVLNWEYTGREFLYWTTQNWADNSIITLSPFADKIKFKLANSVVDNIFNSFYDYSILQANGISFPRQSLSVNREDGLCTISSMNTTEGIYFATLNSIQKEHGMVFNNATMFNDTIYDIETGYRQRRMKLLGFRTAKWDGDFFSPGFVYDSAIVEDWKTYTDYKYGDVVRFTGKYYSAIENILGSPKFDFTKWTLLGDKPVAKLLPNFDYKINQFEDFYSLDIDNFDSAQQKMAQHLIGYTPRVYLNNIFTNPVSQYKFYQGFIKEKGTRNSITKLAKASIHNLQGEIDYTEEWAFRVGHYGSFDTFKEIEIPLKEGQFIENPQVVTFVDQLPTLANDLLYYSTASDRLIVPSDYVATQTFVTTSSLDVIKLETAGFVRFDDIDYTAYNETSISDISNVRNLNDGDIVWLGNKKNGDWDVLRYTLDSARVVRSFMDPATVGVMTFVTKGIHNLAVGDIVTISQFDDTINGIYTVTKIPRLNQFNVSFQSTVYVSGADPSVPGLLFKFQSVRYNSFDELPSDSKLLKLPIDTKVWIEDDGTGRWVVYKKIKNYDSVVIPSSTLPDDQKLGWSITKKKSKDIFLVGAPGLVESPNTGTVFVYSEKVGAVESKFRYGLNSDSIEYYTPGGQTDFGYSLAYDDRNFDQTGYGLMMVGAPAVSFVKSNAVSGQVNYSTGTEPASAFVEQGLIKISSIDPVLVEENTERVLLSPKPASYERFGSALFQTSDFLLVGAPQTDTVGTGTVYAFGYSTSTGYVNFNYKGIVSTSTIQVASTGSRWGSSIVGSDDASFIAISAPGYNTNTGLVSVFAGTSTTYIQTIQSPFGLRSKFGESMKMSSDGQYLFVAAPESRSPDNAYGKVAVYKQSAGTYTLLQIISNPVAQVGMKFGQAIDVNSDSTELTITAVGLNRHISVTFDKFSSLLAGSTYVNDPDSDLSDMATTYDSGTTTFYDKVVFSGSAYVYNRKNNLFRLAAELSPTDTNTGTNYGYSLAMNDNSIYIGAPAFKNKTQPDDARSAFYQFYKIDSTQDNWQLLREQDDLVEVDTLQKVTLVDTINEDIVEYLDVIDPLKGKIAGIVEQDLTYRSNIDPAVYTIGNSNTVNDTNTNWLDDHVGELWWDLSTVKYVMYEQGDLTYRKNNWGKLFPGASIDVYEWVSSDLLPNEWSAQADTPDGLTRNISGQPKYTDNSVVSVKQIYNSYNNSFSNQYYYWVKNKAIVPNVKNRRISSRQAAAMIENPTQYGLKYAAVIDSNAIALANVGNMLVGDSIDLNVSMDVINNNIPKHTEWLLLQENSANSVPNTLLEKKLLDSLLGRDSLGNLVPDTNLSFREKYGIGIRPRQSMFKDRTAALRNVTEFVNSVFIKNRMTGNYSFTNLKKQDQAPDVYSREYDIVVEDNESLNIIDTNLFSQASVSCFIDNGKIKSVQITDPGMGYLLPPEIIIKDNSGAKLLTVIDELGKVVDVIIENSGQGFNSAPVLTVRPFTVIVLSDSYSNGKWAKYIYDRSSNTWARIQTQQYNTPLYWDYIDWAADDYNKFVDLAYTVDQVYQVSTLEDLAIGEYVKVKNGGLGTYIILEKIDGVGTFSAGFNIVYSEKGTIQIKDSIWNFKNTNLGFDQISSYDQTLYDQTPDKELEYILAALKNDLFVNELKVNWNLLFFKAVKYALSEQKLLDWAFKTSFINVVNYAGILDQRNVYKLQNSEFYEDYLKEVKPYHTKIRNFTTNYTLLEPSGTQVTDFDLPAYYDADTNKIEVIEFESLTPKSEFTLTNTITTSYPWKSWTDNYTFSVNSISISNPGSGYTVTPTVEIIANGDQGSGATARAYIRSGEVYEIEIINSGDGYIQPPIIYILGGGENVTPATAYANLYNGKVRSTTVGMKFDRTSKLSQLDSIETVDKFICDGSTSEFRLTWLPFPDKLKVTVKLDQTLVLGSDYTLIFDQQYYGDLTEYSEKFCTISFLNYVPAANQVLEISYVKNINVLNATDRILNYYTATSGMPGLDLSQLMTGIVYPKTHIEALKFDYTTKWGIDRIVKDSRGNTSTVSSYGVSPWADDIGYYVSTTSTNTSTSIGNTQTSIPLYSVQGIVAGQFANVISTTTNIFTTATVRVISVNTLTKTITLSTGTVKNISTGSTIEFWSYSADLTILDSAIDGGTWDTSTRITALGINPEDINITGDGFITPNTSYAPEELVPGEIHESLGINVYTKNPEGAPVVVSSYFDVVANTTTTAKLSIVPPNYASIQVVFENQILLYNTNTNFTTSTQFTVDWDTNEIIVAPQPTIGKVGYTIVSIGGGRSDIEAGIIDSASVTISDVTSASTNTTQVVSLSMYDTVKTAYVTVDGVSVPNDSLASMYYTLGPAGSGSNRAAVTVYGLPANTTSTITAWFFGNAFKYFNEVTEQIVTLDGNPSLPFIPLDNPPAVIQPASSQILVELTDSQGTRILRPPHVDYYEVTNTLTKTYKINTLGYFDHANIRLFINGSELRAGFDFDSQSFDLGQTYYVTILVELNLRDVIAIVAIPDNIFNSFDYDVVGNTLKLNTRTPLLDPGPATGTLKIITYTNHDDMLIRTERFNGNPNRRYKMSRPALDQNYVWVVVNGIPLINNYDYEILDDMITVQVSDAFEHNWNYSTGEGDDVMITSIGSGHLASTILGYRIFNDIFDRTHYKRLSKENTTYLVRDLYFTDTEIHVNDASVLRTPDIAKNIPGVVLVDAERIEFFKINGNVLSQLRRSTLGTAPSFYSEIGTKVIDQGPDQTVPYSDQTSRQDLLTTFGVGTYTILTNSHIVNTGTYQQFVNDGITLSTSTAAADQISVFYGGRPLRKTGVYMQDLNISYDSPVADLTSVETVADKSLLPITEVLGTSYIETSTNKVWVYERSLAETAVNGFVYRGLDWKPAEFTVNTGTHQITLNIEDGVQGNILLTIVKKEFARNAVWNNEITTSTTVSLMDSNTVQAEFLQARPAELPDKYYYGGDPALTEDNGFTLTDEKDQPLEGY